MDGCDIAVKTVIKYSKYIQRIKLAHNVAVSDGVQLRADHIRSALRANGYTIPTPGSTDPPNR
jgi:hypothetical protein